MSGRLENRVALVTGGSSGISRAVATQFARQGASVMIADVRPTPKEGGRSTDELIRAILALAEQHSRNGAAR